MTEAQAISYIENYGWSTTRLGLSRTKELLEKLGNPQKHLKFIHVAGSNGKGSACAMFDAILRAAGYKTGLYISPYIEVFNERIRVNGCNIPGDRLARVTEQVMQIAETMEDHPSQFELVTAAALQYFYEEQCDLVVLEVGMGGASDSTNAIDAPELAVITNIGLEHTEYLGDTLEAIAEVKAGIIKPGCACVCYNGASEVTNVLRQVCEERDVPLYITDFSKASPLTSGLDGQTFTWEDRTYHLNLIGPHQLHNAALVLTGIQVLRARGWQIPGEAVLTGLNRVQWPARLEVLWKEPLFILDGGHNPQCAEALVQSIEQLLDGNKVIFLTGVLADKDYQKIMAMMMPYAKSFVCVTPNSPRKLPAEDLCAYLQSCQAEACACTSIQAGVLRALMLSDADTPVIAFGSLYLAGTVRQCFTGVLKRWQRRRCLQARRGLSDMQRREYSRLICDQLIGMPELSGMRTILSYYAMPGEPDLTAFHEWAVNHGIRIAYPVTGAAATVSKPDETVDDVRMEAFIPESKNDFIIGKYDIKEPDPTRSEKVHPSELDAVLVPCVGYDDAGRRLGHGAGYYDRYLPRCPQAIRIMIAFSVQKLPEIAVEETDLPIEKTITEKYGV